MKQQLETNKSYYSIVQHGLTTVLLRANDNSHFSKQSIEHQPFISEWIAKNEAIKVPFQHLNREAIRRQTEAFAKSEAEREERKAAEHERTVRIREAVETNATLTFVSVIDKPESNDFYTEGDLWTRKFKQAEYDAAWTSYRHSQTQRENEITEYFDGLNDGDQLNATNVVRWQGELLNRGIYASWSDSEDYLFPIRAEFDAEVDGVYIEAVLVDNNFNFKQLVSLDPAEQLTLRIPNRKYFVKRLSRYSDGRLTIELGWKAIERLETTVYLKFDETWNESEIVRTPKAEVSTGGTTRSIAETIAYAELLNVAAAIGAQWEQQLPTVEKR